MKSWRDFSYLDEYDPEDAESREEKRWMERRNAKERQKREREEQTRLRNLVDLSYKLDPRIKRVKEACTFSRPPLLSLPPFLLFLFFLFFLFFPPVLFPLSAVSTNCPYSKSKEKKKRLDREGKNF
jgi:hypothetical protein